MSSCCGQSYIVNENSGPHGGRKKDTSFRSFITFMLALLLVYLAVYCVILSVTRRSGHLSEKSQKADQFLASTNQADWETSTGPLKADDVTTTSKGEDVETEATIFESDSVTEHAINDKHGIFEATEDGSTVLYPSTESSAIIEAHTEESTKSGGIFDASTKLGIILEETSTTTKNSDGYEGKMVATTDSGIILAEASTTTKIGNDNQGKTSDSTQSGFASDEPSTTVKNVNDNEWETSASTILGSILETTDISHEFASQSSAILEETSTTAQTSNDAERKTEFSTTVFKGDILEKETTTTNTVDDEGKRTTNSFTKPSDATTNVATVASVEAVEKRASTPPNLVSRMSGDSVCGSPECKAEAAAVLGTMDHSVDPCEDFYQFSCGNFKSEDDSAYSALLNVLQTTRPMKDRQLGIFQKFFDVCVQYHAPHGYYAKVEQVLSSNIQPNNLTTLLANMILRQSTPLFEVNYGPVGSEEGYGLQILPPTDLYGNAALRGWSLEGHIRKKCQRANEAFAYKPRLELKAVYDEFKKCQDEMLKILVQDLALLTQRGRKPAKDSVFEAFLKFFLNKKKISEIDIQSALTNKMFTKTDVQRLNKQYPSVDWLALLKKVVEDPIDQSTPVYLYLEDEYFRKIMADLNNRMTQKRDETLKLLELYYQLQFYENLATPKADARRFCVGQAVELMPEIADNILSELSNGMDIFQPTFEKLKNTFYWLIDMSNQNEPSKNGMKAKLDLLKLEISTTTANASVGKYLFTNDYFWNLISSLETKKMMSLSQKRALRSAKFPMPVPYAGTIVIPQNFVHTIWQHRKSPAYASNAYLAFHLGRAIAQYLDESGTLFYKQFQTGLNAYQENVDGERNWRGQEIVYKENPEIWSKVVQSSTLDRTADNLALQVAFQSVFPQNSGAKKLPWISDDFAPDKQFFILLAQEFCEAPTLPELADALYATPKIPDIFRIDSMMSNSRDFGDIFRCAQGSRMNPEEKVVFDSFTPPEEYTYEETVNK